jgi:hypothetical protein
LSQTLVAQASQPEVSLAPAVHSLCAHVVPHDVSPQTESTSATHAGPHWLAQHDGLTAQIIVTHASHPEASLTPSTQSSCTHAAPPLLELDEAEEDELDDEAEADPEDELDDEAEADPEDEPDDEADPEDELDDTPGEPPAPLDAEAVTSLPELDEGAPPAPPALEEEDDDCPPPVSSAPPAPAGAPEISTVPCAQLGPRARAKASAAKVRKGWGTRHLGGKRGGIVPGDDE